jgi:hypothetical protein
MSSYFFKQVNQEKIKFKIVWTGWKNCNNEHQMASVIPFRRLLHNLTITSEAEDRIDSWKRRVSNTELFYLIVVKGLKQMEIR